MVYVLNQNGQPLMPTDRYGKVRRLLNEKKATVINRCPFTIQLLYNTGDAAQPVSLGVDAGTRHIGISATTETKELYAAEVQPRTDITKLLSQRRELRCARRNRKTRYRKARFLNRVKSRHKGWLAPSIECTIAAHLKEIAYVCSILPVTDVTVEVAQFDMQLLKADALGLPLPTGTDYQQGEQLGFWNTREYILWRDGHTCQCCKGKSGDKILNIHHIESRQTGGNSPDNLITLCETCHKGYHAGTVRLPDSVKRHQPLKDAAKMGIMRWTLYNRLKEVYAASGIGICMTYGYVTKNTRITNHLEKSHIIDARCISGHPEAEPLGMIFQKRQVRRHNRQLHKLTIRKGGIRKSNQAQREVFGFRLFDRVRYGNEECFVFGRRSSGYFDIRHLDGTKVHAGLSWKKLHLLEHTNTILTERRPA